MPINSQLSVLNNIGTLNITTFFNDSYSPSICKMDHEQFRTGGTAINHTDCFEAIFLEPIVSYKQYYKIRVFINEYNSFDTIGRLSPEIWINKTDRHCYVSTYKDINNIDCEWLISHDPITDQKILSINLDIIENEILIKRLQCSPYFPEFKIIT